MEQAERIAAKIERLRYADQAYRIFGANGHKYRFNAPLEAEDVRQFERRNNITLPAEYAWFLTTLGDGGTGPYYGILSLEESVNRYVLERDPAYLSKPFPLHEAYSYVAELLDCAGVETLEEWDRRSEEDPEYARRVEECLQSKAEGFPLAHGQLAICHFGCGIMFCLTVCGPEYGSIWIDHMADDMGVFPLRNKQQDKARVSFLDWYENWLDVSLLRLEGREREARELSFY